MTRVVPPIYLFLSIGIMFLLHTYLPGPVVPFSSRKLLAIVIGIFGLVLGIAAEYEFWKHRASVLPLSVPPQLVTTGVYRFSRNPMYLSLIMFASAVCIWLGSTTPWLAAGLFILILDRVFVRKEEHLLAKAFPEQYKMYCNSVRRWM